MIHTCWPLSFRQFDHAAKLTVQACGRVNSTDQIGQHLSGMESWLKLFDRGAADVLDNGFLLSFSADRAREIATRTLQFLHQFTLN
jgi:hypothetical protein